MEGMSPCYSPFNECLFFLLSFFFNCFNNRLINKNMFFNQNGPHKMYMSVLCKLFCFIQLSNFSNGLFKECFVWLMLSSFIFSLIVYSYMGATLSMGQSENSIGSLLSLSTMWVLVQMLSGLRPLFSLRSHFTSPYS